MARDATIVLQHLDCISLSDSTGRSPYIWPVLMWIDDNTLADQNLLVGGTLVPGDPHFVIKNDMRPGDIADIPYPLGTLGVRFEDNLQVSRLLLTVILWEKHDTPDTAVFAGSSSFATEIRTEVAAHLVDLIDEHTRAQTIVGIKTRVGDKVASAIWNALTGQEKLGLVLGTWQRDNVVGADFSYFPELTSKSFALAIADSNGSNSYTIQCGLRTHVASNSIDLCQAKVDAVSAAQKTVDDINGEIISLTAEMQTASPAEKPYIHAQIQQDSNSLAVATADLETARQTLKDCRDHWTQIVSTLPVATGPTIPDAQDTGGAPGHRADPVPVRPGKVSGARSK